MHSSDRAPRRRTAQHSRRTQLLSLSFESLELRQLLAQVAGSIGSDTIWSRADSPYEVTGNVTVTPAATLTIEPGVVVQFRPNTGLTINGRLLADGTPTEHIRFERKSAGKWSGVTFKDTLADNRISYADMLSGDAQGEAIDVDHARLTLDHLTWTGTAGTVIEVNHPSLIVRNSQFPTSSGDEVIHGEHVTGSEYLIIDGNVFANSNNGGDVIDFLGADRPGPVLQVLNNVFMGGGDDGLDLDGTDAHIEGNVFMNFRKNTSRATTSNAIATGLPQSGEDFRTQISVVRNIFVNNDHALLLKEDAFAVVEHNLFLNSRIAAIQFNEVGGSAVQGVGKGADIRGNIFENNAQLFRNLIDQPAFKTQLTLDQNLLPNDVVDFGGTPVNAHDLGIGNVAGDPLFVNAAGGDYRLLPGSPAIDVGPMGLDMGPLVPAGPQLQARGAVSTAGQVTLDVGGPGITRYRYRLDDGPLQPLTSIEVPIELTELGAGAHSVEVVGMNDAGEWFTGQSTAWQDHSLQLIAPRRTRTGEHLPIVARNLDWQGLPDPNWSDVLSLTNSGLSESQLVFRKGVATLSATVTATADFSLQSGDGTRAVEVLPTNFLTQDVSGTLVGETVWTNDREYHVVGDLTIPAGSQLTISPGTRVLLGDKVNLVVRGSLLSQGALDDPILFNSLDPAKPWGGLEFLSGSVGSLRDTFLTNGGADPARVFGHSDSQPLIRAVGASVACDNCYLIFNEGKGFGTTNARLEILNSVISNVDTGGEFSTSVVHVNNSWLTNISNAERTFVNDDNDGFYFSGVHSSGEPSRFENSYIVNTKDDGIDHNGARLEVENAWIQDTFHEGIAASNSNWARIHDSVFTGSNQGVEAGYGGPDVTISQSVIVRSRSQVDPEAPINAGLRFGDGYDGSNGAYTGHITATHNVIHDNGDNVRNYDGQIQGPRPGAIEITASLANDPDATDPSNIDGVAVFSPSLHLLRSSAGFTAGPDGMPVGRPIPGVSLTLVVPNSGDFNQDGQLNELDIHLFCAALQGDANDPAYDLNGDGSVDPLDRDELIFDRLGTTYGDSNLDGIFNSADLVQVFVEGKYEDQIPGNTQWGAGDWNCDGDFDTQDLVLAFQAGGYSAAATDLTLSAHELIPDLDDLAAAVSGRSKLT